MNSMDSTALTGFLVRLSIVIGDPYKSRNANHHCESYEEAGIEKLLVLSTKMDWQSSR